MLSVLLQIDPTIVDFLAKFSLLGIPCIILIPFIIGAVKASGWLPKGWGGIAAMVVSIAIFALAGLVQWLPDTAGPISFLLGGIIVGLSSVGGYSMFDAARKNATETTTPQNPGA